MICISFISAYIGMIISAISATPNISTSPFIILCVGRIIIGMSNESMRLSLKVFIIKQFSANSIGKLVGIFIGCIQLSAALNAVLTYRIYVVFNDSIQMAIAWILFVYPIMAIPLFICILTMTHHTNKSGTTIEMMETEQTELVQQTEKDKKFKISHIALFPSSYWLLVIIGALTTVSYQTFVNIIVSYLHQTFSYSYTISTNFASIGNFQALFALIFIGWFTDKYGQKCKILLCSSIMCVTAFAILKWASMNVTVTFIALLLLFFAVGFLTTSVFPGIPVVLNDVGGDSDLTGTGYGVYTSVLYTSIAIGYVAVGLLTKSDNDEDMYENVVYFEMSAPALAALLSVVLLYLDKMKYESQLETRFLQRK